MGEVRSPGRSSVRIVASGSPEVQDREIEISVGQVLSVGRAAGCDVVVPDTQMSRRHATFQLSEQGTLEIADLGSANGTFVGGRRIDKATVPHGGRFTLGATTFELDSIESREVAPGTVVMNLADLASQLETPRALSEQGEEVVALANEPFLARDPSSMWWVESGKVELFIVQLDAGEPVGARTHFLTIGAGEVFFGIDTEGFDHYWGILAVGKAGSRLRRFDLYRLQVLALVPAHRPVLSDLIETWIRSLTRRLASEVPEVPTPGIVLEPGEEASLEPGKVLAGAGGSVVWVPMPPAFFLFEGLASISPEVEGVLFPLAPGAWLERLGSEERDPELTAKPRLTREAIRDARLWAGIDAFHRVVCECETINRQVAVADEAVRLDLKAERAESARKAGIGAIEAVLGGARAWERPSFGGAGIGPVFQACGAVAAASGIEVRRPLGDLEVLSFDEKVQAVASASHFRIRKVTLLDDWWNRDQGPMLAAREETKAPVAILPTKPGSYELYDPEAGKSIPLDADVAETIAPFAFSFYRPFPDGPLGAKDLIRFAVGNLRREFRDVALAGVLVGLMSTVIPSITGKVFDQAIPQAERTLLLQMCLGVFLVAIGSAAFKITQNVAMIRIQSRMDYSAQSAIWDRLLNLPVTFFRGYSAGDLADRAGAIDKIRSIIAGTGVSAILGSFASLFNAVQMCFYSIPLALVAITLTLIYVAMTTLTNYLKLKVQRRQMYQKGALTGLVLQLISGVTKLRVSGAEPHAFRVWATAFSRMRQTSFTVGRIGNLMPVINGGFPVFSSLIVFFTVATLHQQAAEAGEIFELSTGDFLAFSAAYGIFLGAMQALGDASVNMLNVVPVYERLRPILQEEPEVDRTKAAPTKLRGGIELSHISFRYTADGPYILKDVSLRIQPGEMVALVGGSGSGKSTLMKIMLGFERPEKGAVYYDGQDLSTLDVRLVRQQLGVVLQESRLLPADIYRNIVGSSSRSVAEAWEAAHRSGLADDIKRMPMGMHTYVSEGGGGFSGGQKQRLMIARALVHDPKILYLDEATSALDNRTQKIVTESMERLQATRVVIAHRLSTIVNADRICYLEQGELIEQGSYEELMKLDGAFAALARRQLA